MVSKTKIKYGVKNMTWARFVIVHWNKGDDENLKWMNGCVIPLKAFTQRSSKYLSITIDGLPIELNNEGCGKGKPTFEIVDSRFFQGAKPRVDTQPAFKYAAVLVKYDPAKNFVRLKGFVDFKDSPKEARVGMMVDKTGWNGEELVITHYNNKGNYENSITLHKGMVIDRDLWNSLYLPLIRFAGHEYTRAIGRTPKYTMIPTENLGNNVYKVYV